MGWLGWLLALFLAYWFLSDLSDRNGAIRTESSVDADVARKKLRQGSKQKPKQEPRRFVNG